MQAISPFLLFTFLQYGLCSFHPKNAARIFCQQWLFLLNDTSLLSHLSSLWIGHTGTKKSDSMHPGAICGKDKLHDGTCPLWALPPFPRSETTIRGGERWVKVGWPIQLAHAASLRAKPANPSRLEDLVKGKRAASPELH